MNLTFLKKKKLQNTTKRLCYLFFLNEFEIFEKQILQTIIIIFEFEQILNLFDIFEK